MFSFNAPSASGLEFFKHKVEIKLGFDRPDSVETPRSALGLYPQAEKSSNSTKNLKLGANFLKLLNGLIYVSLLIVSKRTL